MSVGAPICVFCRRLHKRAFGEALTCDAFPDRIPDDILVSKADHRQPFKDDQGKTFVPKNSKAATAAAKIIRLAQLPRPRPKSRARRARDGEVTE